MNRREGVKGIGQTGYRIGKGRMVGEREEVMLHCFGGEENLIWVVYWNRSRKVYLLVKLR